MGAPLVYVNQVGATDEMLFDGGSFALDRAGKALGRLPFFKPAFGVVDDRPRLDRARLRARARTRAPTEIEILHRALVSGIREYFARTGFQPAIVGLSGGIDSAVVATLAAQALGSGERARRRDAEPVLLRAIASPTPRRWRGKLGIKLEVRPIKFVFSHALARVGRGQRGACARGA